MKLKQPFYLLVDIVLIIVSLLAAFSLRFGTDVALYYFRMFLFLLPLSIVAKLAIFYLFGFYSQLWRYASLKEGLRLFWGISVASLLILGILYFIQRPDTPRGIIVIDWLLTLGLIGGSRFLARARKDIVFKPSAKEQKRVIIFGAGEAGSMLVKYMQRHPDKGYAPIAFLDDDPAKTGMMIHGIKVVGGSRLLPTIMSDHPADEVVLAIPSADRKDRKRVALACKELGIPCKTIPDISELVDGEASLLQIRDIDPKELLGRKEVEIDLRDTIKRYEGKVILITGAAGSIGSELCRQVISLKPSKVIATDVSENGLYHLDEEMSGWLDEEAPLFETHIMDVRDPSAIDRLFFEFKPAIIFHAAAYKHVPIMEKHPLEAMENNFFGTQNLIEAAKKHGCERFAFISTDKAVKPTSIMGFSKQLGEKTIKLAASKSDVTKFMAVRFGNVLGSNGSVIPKFKRQIKSGEAVTVTHPDITRYFMTIHEAVYLVIQATAMGEGGEIFVLNMGEPVKIIDLARSMIRLFGLEPEKEVPIKITGLRPGEKLYEELFAEEETVNTTRHPKIFQVLDDFNEAQAQKFLDKLEVLVKSQDKHELMRFLNENRLIKV